MRKTGLGSRSMGRPSGAVFLWGVGIRIAKVMLKTIKMKYVLYIIGFIELVAWITCFYLASPSM